MVIIKVIDLKHEKSIPYNSQAMTGRDITCPLSPEMPLSLSMLTINEFHYSLRFLLALQKLNSFCIYILYLVLAAD
jgi:hypothetical protein